MPVLTQDDYKIINLSTSREIGRFDFVSKSLRESLNYVSDRRGNGGWLNQIEIWFSILARKLLRRASFTSKEDLKARIEAFIAYFNRTLAKPFKWTMTGKPLAA